MHEHERPATTLVGRALGWGSAVALEVINNAIALLMIKRRNKKKGFQYKPGARIIHHHSVSIYLPEGIRCILSYSKLQIQGNMETLIVAKPWDPEPKVVDATIDICGSEDNAPQKGEAVKLDPAIIQGNNTSLPICTTCRD